MKKTMIAFVSLLVVASVFAVENPNPFYVYQDAGSRTNHFIPSGWMGSYKSLHLNQRALGAKSGKTCLQITYDVHKDSDTSWAGIYWESVSQNWGSKKFGYDLSGFTKLTFWAKGKGYIEKIGMGGVTGQTEEGDSADVFIGPIDLTPEWKQYTLDLKDADLHHVIGGFYFATPAEYNEQNVELYLDDVKYEK